jgi:hypothetical protein
VLGEERMFADRLRLRSMLEKRSGSLSLRFTDTDATDVVSRSRSRRIVVSMVGQTEDAFGARVSKVAFGDDDDASQNTRESVLKSPTKDHSNPPPKDHSHRTLLSTSPKNHVEQANHP